MKANREKLANYNMTFSTSIKVEPRLEDYYEDFIKLNKNLVPDEYFAVLTETEKYIIQPLRELGYVVPYNVHPHISIGRHFPRFLIELNGDKQGGSYLK